jgi:hypothetical protein
MAAKPPSEQKWWQHIGQGIASLNSLPFEIDGQWFNKWTPADVNKLTLSSFLRDLHRRVPVFYFAQFEIAPQLVIFKYSVGSVVRPKLLATLSALIGIKRSEENLKKIGFKLKNSFLTWPKIIPLVRLIAASIFALANWKCLTSGIWCSAIEHVVIVVGEGLCGSLLNIYYSRTVHF